MFLSDTSIERPVLTTVVSIAIVLVGAIGYRALAVRELPDIEYPIVSVTTILPGASPEVVETEVTEVLEEEINTIEGIKTLTSVSAEQTSLITAEFQLQRDVDIAFQDVRAKVSRIRGELPDDVEEPVIDKLDPEASPIIWLPIQAPDAPLSEVNEYAENVVKERLQTLPGVGSVILGGEQRFAVRVRLDSRKLAAYDLTVDDIQAALQRRNVDLPSGRIESESREFTVRTEGEFTTPEAFNELIVAWRGGSPIRLREVGYAEGGVENERTLARYNGEPTVGVGVIKQSDANTVAVADAVLEEVEGIRAQLPAGWTIRLAVNNAEFIEASLEEVQETILIAFLLVVAVILLFLRSWRATLIPSIAIPVSIIGTFAALYLLGFSINTLTLLALVLAIGIVVDDAIVVVENIYRHMEEGESPEAAARKGTAEIAFAVIAISLTLVIVFLPIAFIQGIVGRLFREFGLGVAAAVLISAFIALTLTPMLSSRFLHEGEESDNIVFRTFERWLSALTDGYRRALRWSLDRRLLVVLVAAVSLGASLYIAAVMGKEFVPPEDRGQFLMIVSAPEGATLDYTDHYMSQIEAMTAATEGIEGFFSAIGIGIGGPARVNQGIVFVRMHREREQSQFAAMDALRREVGTLAGVDVFVIAPNALDPSGFEQPLQYVVQSDDLEELASVAGRVADRARQLPTLVGVDTDLELNKPELRVSVDRAKAASLGVDISDVATTLQVLMGGRDLSEFERGSERYEVMVQLQDSLRSTPSDLSSVYVRGEDDRLVQLANVVTVEEGVGPNQINHYNRRRSVTLSASPRGVPLGEALSQVRGVAGEELPAGFTTEVAGQSQDFQESFSSLVFALVMAVIAIYLVLAAQFESFVHPLTIMLALPLAMIGAVIALVLFGMTLNIYSMIGIIMLQGLVTKNSILLVDYANQERRRGSGLRDAVVRAGTVRLRPILMTSISIIIGVTPIALALGAGAESRRPLGTAVIGGMLTSTVLTLFVVPVFYTLLDEAGAWLRDRIAGLSRERARAGSVAAVVVFMMGVAAGAGAQQEATEPRPLSLEQAIEHALTFNEDVLIARAEQARTAGVVREVRARSLPELSLSFDYTRNIQTPVLFFNSPEGVQQISIGNDNEYNFSLRLEQSLLDFSLGPARAAARLSEDATEASVSATRDQVALAVRQAYYRVLLDRALLRVQERAMEQARFRLEQVERFRAAGTASEFDLLTAQVEVDNIRPQLVEARSRLVLDRNRLKRTVGLPLDEPVALSDSLAGPDTVPALASAVRAAFRNRDDLRGQRVRVALQEQSLISENRSALPTLSLNAQLTRRASSNDFFPPQQDFSQSTFAGLSFEVPLFDGRSRSARVQQAEASLDRERFRLQRLRADVELQVEQAHASLEAAREQIEATTATVARAERALAIAQTRFRNGLSTQVELNDAELAVTRARTNHAQALFNYNVARAELLAAMGERR